MTECEKAECEPQVEQTTIKKDEVVRFAKVLLSLVGENERKKWFGELGINYFDYRKISVSFPRWQQAFLALTYKELIGTNEFTEFSGDERGTPSYEVLEYQRDKSTSLPVEGYSWITTSEKNVILEIDFSGYSCWINAYHNKEDQELTTAFLQQLKERVDSMDHLKGEKLLVTSGNRIKFFKFKHTTKDELILHNKIWDSIERNLITFLKRKQELEEYGLDWRRGILMWGPPGTGKTLLGKYFCTNLEETILWVTPKCIRDTSDVEKMFEMARVLAPTIIFIEDLDFFAASRDYHGLHPILGELLTQLDGISSNDGVFVVGTTNNQRILDKAIASRPSRFDVRLEIGHPEQPEREKLFQLFSKERGILTYSLLATRSNGFSAAHIKEACVRGVLSIMYGETDLEKTILAAIDEIREEELNRPAPTGPIS